MEWGGTWARYGNSDEGLPHYVRHLAEVRATLSKFTGGPVRMRNRAPLLLALNTFVLGNAILPAKVKQLQADVAGLAPRAA